MSTKILSGQQLKTVNYDMLGGAATCSLSLFFRLNKVYLTGIAHTLFGKASFQQIVVYRFNVTPPEDVALSLQLASGTKRLLVNYVTGVVYHVAITYDGANVYFYVDGVLLGTQAGTGLVNSITSSGLQLGELPANAALDYEVSDVCVWNGYVLTAADVKNIRDGLAASTSISPGNLVWHASLSGTPGATIQNGDPGLNDTVGSHPLTVSSGAPTWSAPLVYTAPTRVRAGYPKVGPSGKTLVFYAEDNNGNAGLLTQAPAGLTYSVNGGAAQTPVAAPWSAANAWFVVPLNAAVLATDTLTWSAPDGWLVTGAGPAAATTNGPVTNATGGSLLPAFTSSPKAMKVGWNGVKPLYYNPANFYANLVKQASQWLTSVGSFALDANLYPINLAGGSNPYCIISGANTGPAGYVACPTSGTWTLLWDGTGNCSLGQLTNMTVTELPGAVTGQSTGNRRTYSITRNTSSPTVQVTLNVSATPSRTSASTRPGCPPTAARSTTRTCCACSRGSIRSA
jgi:hypothetical protein